MNHVEKYANIYLTVYVRKVINFSSSDTLTLLFRKVILRVIVLQSNFFSREFQCLV
jgi:hypothetical protein